jgi:membrane protease YdiL (CAAX protease family)
MVLIRDFCKFLVHGKVYDAHNKLDRTFIFSYLFLKVFIVVLFVLIKYLFSESISEQKNDVFSDTNSLKLFMNVVILAPILEEIICRYHFKFSYKSIFISILFACFWLYDDLNFLLVLLIYFFILLTLIRANIRFNKMIFVYISSTIFAFLHLMAYPDILQSQNVMDIILILSPHFFGGLLLSYVFFRNGIFTAIALHSLWNFIPYTINLLKAVLIGEF